LADKDTEFAKLKKEKEKLEKEIKKLREATQIKANHSACCGLF